ncbi:MAG: hypothetical protein NWP54_04710, partial [Polaribacter sp.]|nr:hypothetical protein [Polaribacter sp.]
GLIQPVTSFPLKSLKLSNNNIKDLSNLTGKKITLISKSTGEKKVVDTNGLKIENLDISSNNLETLNVDDLENLKSIDVSNNPDLITMSIKNGNNANITSFKSTNTPNMSCIIFDDKDAHYLTTCTK